MNIKKIVICNNFRANPSKPSCAAKGSESIAIAIEEAILHNQLDISLERFKCLGDCEHGPNLKLYPQGRFIQAMTKDNLPSLIDEIIQFSKN